MSTLTFDEALQFLGLGLTWLCPVCVSYLHVVPSGLVGLSATRAVLALAWEGNEQQDYKNIAVASKLFPAAASKRRTPGSGAIE